MDPAEIHLAVIPCTAFEGNPRKRMGMGAGYYDRYLPGCINAVRIAVAYEAQHILGLYVEQWDIAPDAIITEKNRY